LGPGAGGGIEDVDWLDPPAAEQEEFAVERYESGLMSRVHLTMRGQGCPRFGDCHKGREQEQQG
jgi:hypothetical protein